MEAYEPRPLHLDCNRSQALTAPFDIKNWIRGVNGCPEARAGRLVQVVHRRDPRAAQRPPRVSGAAAHDFTKFYRESIGRSGPAATYTDDRDEGRVRLVRRAIRGAWEGV